MSSFAVASTSKSDFSFPREENSMAKSGRVIELLEARSTLALAGMLFFSSASSSLFPPSFLSRHPKDERCIKHYRHSVSCGSASATLSLKSYLLIVLESRIGSHACEGARARAHMFPTSSRVYEKRPWKINRSTIRSLPSWFLARLPWDLLSHSIYYTLHRSFSLGKF